jgi:hypothetical protein
MRREAFVPIDDELAAAIRQQQGAVLAQWPQASYLAPAPNSPDGSATSSPAPTATSAPATTRTPHP